MSAYTEVYVPKIVNNKDFWEFDDVEKIGDHLCSLTLNYIVYRLGECISSNMSYGGHPVIGVELHMHTDKPYRTAYYGVPESAINCTEILMRGLNAEK
jgi:hypothetical protein